MPIFQTFAPANTLAVAHDHDYLLLTPEDNFLESISVLNITPKFSQTLKTSMALTSLPSMSRFWTGPLFARQSH
jgi:hypothetical protein